MTAASRGSAGKRRAAPRAWSQLSLSLRVQQDTETCAGRPGVWSPGGGMARGPVSSLAWCCRAQPQRPCAHSGVLTRGAGSVGGCLAAGLSLLGSQPPACPLPTQSPPWPDTVRPLAVRPPCQAGSRLGRGSAASLPSARRGRMHRVRDGFSETFPPRPPSPDESARQEQSVSLLRSCLNGE